MFFQSICGGRTDEARDSGAAGDVHVVPLKKGTFFR